MQTMAKNLVSVARETDYPVDAFLFLQRGLDFTVRRLHGDPPEEQGHRKGQAESRHVSGQQLCYGLRDFAIQEYGLMARTVLKYWGIRNSLDFGRMVFALVEADLLQKTEQDRIEDFEDVFDFADAFSLEISIEPM